jgi:valyl-tRNA synthetase
MKYYNTQGEDDNSSTSSIIPYDKIMSELEDITEEGKKELDIKYNLEENKHDLEKMIESEKNEIKRLIKKINDKKYVENKPKAKIKRKKSEIKVFKFSSDKCTKKGYYLSIACVIILVIIIYFIIKKLK